MSDALAAVLARAGVAPLSPEGCVWDLAEVGLVARAMGARSVLTPPLRREILEVVAAGARRVFLLTTEDLSGSDLGGFVPVSDGVWSLERPGSLAHLLQVYEIQCGSWVLLVADAAPASPMPDLMRATEAEVVAFMRENRIRALIDSFHDDVEWRVAQQRPGG